MKIAFIGQKGIPTKYGGVERYVEGVSQNLVKLGHEVFVYTRPHYTPSTRKKYKGVSLINLPSINTKHFDAISHVFLSTVHALFKPYDIIHYQGVGPSLLSIIPRILKPRCKVVVTFHSLDRKHAKWSWFAKLILTIGEWTACKFPHQTITVSKALQAYALQRYNAPTTYIPNGVYTDYIDNSKNVLSKYGLKKKQYIIAAARPIKHKRLHDVINAFVNIKETNIKLVIAGGANFASAYSAELKTLASLDDRVVMTGQVAGEDMFALLKNSLAFISASEDEGMPIMVLEALSLATPAILTNIIGHTEITEDCHARFFKVGDLKQLTRHIKFVLNNKRKIAAEAKINQKIIVENYSWHDIAANIEDLYKTDMVASKSLGHTLF